MLDRIYVYLSLAALTLAGTGLIVDVLSHYWKIVPLWLLVIGYESYRLYNYCKVNKVIRDEELEDLED